jgi:hypothetical protein
MATRDFSSLSRSERFMRYVSQPELETPWIHHADDFTLDVLRSWQMRRDELQLRGVSRDFLTRLASSWLLAG